MKTNQGVIVLTDRDADDSRLRSVLHDWGYSEKEIQQFLSEMSTPTQHSLNEHVNAP
jgi:5S rRNA maturation endonuclease (ribonuclease M5)